MARTKYLSFILCLFLKDSTCTQLPDLSCSLHNIAKYSDSACKEEIAFNAGEQGQVSTWNQMITSGSCEKVDENDSDSIRFKVDCNSSNSLRLRYYYGDDQKCSQEQQFSLIQNASEGVQKSSTVQDGICTQMSNGMYYKFAIRPDQVSVRQLSGYTTGYSTGYATGYGHPYTTGYTTGHPQSNTYATHDAETAVYPVEHKTVPATLTYPEQTVQVNQRKTSHTVQDPLTQVKSKKIPYGQTTYSVTSQAQQISTTDQLVTQTKNPFATVTTYDKPVTKTTNINQPIKDQTITTRNFPTKKYAADPNAPHPQYYDHDGYYPGQQDFYVGFDGKKTQYGHGYGNAAYGHGGYYGNPSIATTAHGSAFNTYGNALYLKEGVSDVNKSGKLGGAAIAGIAVGGVCLIGLCIGTVCCIQRSNKYQNGADDNGVELDQVDQTVDEIEAMPENAPNMTLDSVYTNDNEKGETVPQVQNKQDEI